MIILGLSAFYGDSSAALARDRKLVAAAEEKRFRRVKYWVGFPSESVVYCLYQAGLRLADVNYVAVNQDDRAQRLRPSPESPPATANSRAPGRGISR